MLADFGPLPMQEEREDYEPFVNIVSRKKRLVRGNIIYTIKLHNNNVLLEEKKGKGEKGGPCSCPDS